MIFLCDEKDVDNMYEEDDKVPYIAYRDKNKTREIKAKDATIADANKRFYCKTPNCKACMTLVNVADSNRAHFRRIPSGPSHSSIFCSADGIFDPTEYDEVKFDFDKVADKTMNTNDSHSKSATTDREIITGGGGKKAISTVHQIYCMCRKYETYNGYCTDNILADERNFSRYKDGIVGNKIVQCTFFHKIKDKFAYCMNYPSFPYQDGKYIRINFRDEELFWYFYRKFKGTNHKELIIILGDWRFSEVTVEYIAECEIYTKRQIHFLKI